MQCCTGSQIGPGSQISVSDVWKQCEWLWTSSAQKLQWLASQLVSQLLLLLLRVYCNLSFCGSHRSLSFVPAAQGSYRSEILDKTGSLLQHRLFPFTHLCDCSRVDCVALAAQKMGCRTTWRKLSKKKSVSNLAVSFHSISCPSTDSSSSSSVKSCGGGGPSSSSPSINLILSAVETGDITI